MDTLSLLPSILVVDDMLGPRESLRILLKYDFHVHCASSVDEGIEILKDVNPELIVLDINMPGKNGLDGLKAIRDIDRNVAIVMLTGYGCLETAQKAMRLGANDYINKPFDTNEMQQLVKRSVEYTRLARRRELAKKKMEQLNQRLEIEISSTKGMAELGQMSAEFVHDLRSPLTGIHGFVSLISHEIQQTEKLQGDQLDLTKEYLTFIEKEINRCYELSAMWQDLNDKKRRSSDEFSISELIYDLVAGINAAQQNNNIKVEFDLDVDEIAIIADKVQISRALNNILNNAVQSFTDADGTIQVSCKISGDDVEIDITDSGCGIEQEKLDQIFQPYFTTKEVSKGTGLGLYIVKKTIENHSGAILVKSVPNGGTTFNIRIPLAARQLKAV